MVSTVGVLGGAAAVAAVAAPAPGRARPAPTASPAWTSSTTPEPLPSPSAPPATSVPEPEPGSTPSPVSRVAAAEVAAAPAVAAVPAVADARVTLAAGGEVAPGARLFVEASADLVSGSAAAVVLDVDLPTGVSYVPAEPNTSVGRFCSASGLLVTCRDEQPDVGGGTTAGGRLQLEVARDVPVGTVLAFLARAGVEGATDPEPGNDTASGSVRVVAERNVAISWGAPSYPARPSADVVLSLSVENRGDDPVETVVTVTDPTYADGTTGLPRTILDSVPPDQPGRSCFGDAGMILCTLTLRGGQRQVVDYVVRVDPADAGHTLAVRAHADTGSVDATAADDVSVTRLVVAVPQATTSTPPPTGDSTGSPGGTELAATGSDARVTMALAVLGLLFVTGGVAALRFSRGAAGPRRG